MTWWMILLSFVWPVVQPTVQQGVQRLQQRVQQTQLAQPTNQPVYHNGQWWKYENGQWWIWVNQQQPREQIACQQQQPSLSIR